MNPINTCEQPTGGINKGHSPYFVPRAFPPQFACANHSWFRLTYGAAVSGAFLAYLWAVKDRLRLKGKTDYSLKPNL